MRDFNNFSALLFVIIALSCMVLRVKSDQNSSFDSKRGLVEPENQKVYRFDDPAIAYQILEKLDIFEKVPVTKKKLNRKFSKPYLGLIPDNDYCKKHRALIVEHPEVIFTQQNILTSLLGDSLLRRRIIPQVGNDIQPGVRILKGELANMGIYDLRVDANNFFTSAKMYRHKVLGTQYSCLSQESNHVPGHESLYRKDYIAEGVVAYIDYYKDRPRCFNYNKFFPETYILYHKKACKKFFKMFTSEAYQNLKKERGGIVYMRKIGAGVHQGMGVFPIDNKEEAKIRDMYKDGKLCGKLKSNNIIQYFVHNPLLLGGHKFDFRMYMLIASTNPLIAYYHDGFLRVSLHEYTPKSQELGAILTNTALTKSAFSAAAKNGTYNGMTEAQLKDFHLWNFQRLENYLYDNGIVTDRNWLDNYLRPEFKKALVHLIRMSQGPFKKLSSVYHLFGLDFMLDENLKLWFIEANASPALEGFSKEMKDFTTMMVKDHFEIVFGLLRSRMKRVIQYVNKIAKEDQVTRSKSGRILIKNLVEKREEFKQITQNNFEDEFRPNVTNKWQPIIDENYQGGKRYFGLIKKKCL